MTKAILVMDYINEIVHPEGKFKGKGYANFCVEHNVFENVSNAVRKMKESKGNIVYVKVGFLENYVDIPKNSVLFEKAPSFKALQLGSWATDFHSSLDVKDTDLVIVKNRISPFSNPELDKYLKQKGVSEIYLAGVATDLVVQSAARDAHDRDYKVFVLSDCCAAGSLKDHEDALSNLEKFVRVDSYKNLL